MNAWRVIQNIGLTTLVGVSLTCDSNTKNLSSTIDNNKINIENILTKSIDTNTAKWWNIKYIRDNTSQNITDSLIQSEILSQNIITKDTINTDTIQIANNNGTNHTTTDTMQKWPNNTITIPETSSKENIKKTLSKEECDIIIKSQLRKAVEEIVVKTDKLDFDVEYMRWQVWLLLKDFFSLQDNETWIQLRFTGIEDQDKKNIINYMDNIRSHIKSNNWLLVKIFLTKSKLREFTKENIPVVYKILTKDGTIAYTWWENQFTIDINNIINTYK